MKKIFSLVLSCILATSVFAVDEIEYALREGFEGTGLPSGWTEEFVSGHQSWVIETAAQATFPTDVMEGNQRIAIRNTTDHWVGFTTRLISPVMDLSNLLQPILIVGHAQQQMTGDYEHLKVLYRSEPNDNWIQLKEFKEKIPVWKSDTLVLAAPSKTYQIAFEVSDALGRGVVLDQVAIRPKPTCEDPSNLVVTSLTTTTAGLTWNGSLDTDSFRVLISTEQLNVDSMQENSKSIVSRLTVPDFELSLTDLVQNQQYYVYLKGYCPSESTGWVEQKFRTLNYVSLPYTQHFDTTYLANTVAHPKFWTSGTNLLDELGAYLAIPFVNMNIETRSTYSYNGTTCLCFTGAPAAMSTPIPGGNYAYSVTPELITDDISTLEINFWGMSPVAGNGIIVGVMTDPYDYDSFEPVDTLYVGKGKWFENFSVRLNNYKGKGKYVCFTSDFEKDNIFYLDEVQIFESKGVDRPNKVEISKALYNSIQINAEKVDADSWNIIIANDVKVTNADPQDIIVKREGITSFPYTLTDDALIGKSVNVYVQAVKGSKKSQWTLPVRVLMPTRVNTFPYLMDFELADAVDLGQLVNFQPYDSKVEFARMLTINPHDIDSTARILTSTPVYQNKGSLMIYDNKYIAFPMVDNIKDLEVVFYLSDFNLTDVSAVLDLGVMTDPYDVSTFEAVEHLTTDHTGEFKRCYHNFSDYTGNGKYIAIRTSRLKSRSDYYHENCRIDRFEYRVASDCKEPSQVVIDNDENNNTTMSWLGTENGKWNVVVGKKLLNGQVDPASLVLNTDVTKPTITIPGLVSLNEYYYKISTICGTDTISSDVCHFTAACPARHKLPYFEDFDSYGGAANNVLTSPTCVETDPEFFYGPSYWCPTIRVASSEKYAVSMPNYFYFTKSSSSNPPMRTLYMALPVFEAPLDQLKLSFYVRQASSGKESEFQIGYLTDPQDLSTLVVLKEFKLTTKQYTLYEFRFPELAGKNLYEHLTIVNKTFGTEVYMDDVAVEKVSDCEKILDFSYDEMSITTTGATFKWEDMSAPKYQLVLLSEPIDVDEALSTSTSVAFNKADITGTTYTVNSNALIPDRRYYAYIRSLCTDTTSGDWSNAITFKTACTAVSMEDLGILGFPDIESIDCWTIGSIDSAATAMPSVENGYLLIQNTAKDDRTYAMLPELLVSDITKTQLVFQAHAGTDITQANALSVGIITDESDFATFEVIKKLALPNVSAVTAAKHYGFDECYEYVVRFDEYEGDYLGHKGNRIVLMSESGDLANKIYLDSVELQNIPTNKEPIYVEISDIETYAATLSWDDLKASSYEYILSETAIKDEDLATISADMIKTSTTNKASLTDLKAMTRYFVYVRAIYNGGTSKWSNGRKFTTLCPAKFTLPYMENFDGYSASTAVPYTIPGCWVTYSQGKDGQFNGTARLTSTTSAYGGTGNALYLGSQVSTGNNAFAVAPIMDGDIHNMQISFYYKSSGTTGLRTIVVGIADVAEPYNDMLKSVVWLDTVYTKYGDGTNWYRYSGGTDRYKGNGKYIVVGMVNGCSELYTTSTMGYTYIDNFAVEILPTCMAPEGMEYIRSYSNSVKLSWDGMGATKWQLAAVKGDESLETAKKQIFTSTEGEFTGLDMGTEYTFYMRSICAEGDTSRWSVSTVTASTLYTVTPAQAFWNFDDPDKKRPTIPGATKTMEIDFLSGNPYFTTEAYQPYIIANANVNKAGTAGKRYAYSGDYALVIGYSSITSEYVVLPEIVECNFDTLQIHFKTRNIYTQTSKTVVGQDDKVITTYSSSSYTRTVKVGTLEDPYNFKAIKELATITLDPVTNTSIATAPEDRYWTDVIVPLYKADGKYICIYTEDEKSLSYIDDIQIEKADGFGIPTAVHATDITDTSAVVVWKSDAQTWDVIVSDANTGESIFNSRVDKTEVKLPKLTPQSDYTIQVRAIFGNNVSSKFITKKFSTPCTAINLDEAIWTFSRSEAADVLAGTVMAPGCWSVGTKYGTNKTSASYMPNRILNASTLIYDRMDVTGNTNEGALVFRAYSTQYFGEYAIMPILGFDLKGLVLHFFYRNSYGMNKSTGRFNSSAVGTVHDIVVGYVLDGDINTFVPVDTVTAKLSADVTTSTVATSRSDHFWDEAFLNLEKYAGEGHRIAFLYCNDQPVGTATNYMMVDDVEIISEQGCVSINNYDITNVTSTTAHVEWLCSGTQSYVVQLAKNGDFEHPVYDKTLTDVTEVDFTGLEPATEYQVRIAHACSAHELSDWRGGSFVTMHTIRFAEYFNNSTILPSDWQVRSGNPELVFTGAPLNISSSSSVTWEITNLRYPLYNENDPNGHVLGITSENTQVARQAWIVTPILDLANVTEAITLSFNLALTGADTERANPMQANEFFYLIISDDEGATWKRENSLKWGKTRDSDFTFDELPNRYDGKQYHVDLSKYLGKRIRIAWAIYSPKGALSNNLLHLSNVVVNYCDKVMYNTDLCQYEDFDAPNGSFRVDADELKPGKNHIEYFTAAKKETEKDVLYVLESNVSSSIINEDVRTVCEGESLNLGDFAFDVRQSGVYKQKLISSQNCDSVYVLNLTMTPATRVAIDKSICQGTYYEVGGKKYYTTSIIVDTVASTATGCDSITTTMLTVNPILKGASTMYLCPGTTVNFGKYGDISKAGVYVDTLLNALGCDSIATLEIVEVPNVHDYIVAAICEGEKYTGYGFAGLSKQGDYDKTDLQTEYGCDSIATLHLLVASAEGVINDEITLAMLPYVVNGEELLPVGTEKGKYTFTINLADCGATTLNVTVGEGLSGLSALVVNGFQVSPNPVEAGETIQVMNRFTQIQMANMLMEVFASNGDKVYSSRPTVQPITIPSNLASGMYMVRIMTDNEIYQTKFIVK